MSALPANEQTMHYSRAEFVTVPAVKRLPPGAAMDPATRSFMESRFGTSLGEVRIHTGPYAARAAQSLQARAFTLGTDIVFGEGQYAPATHEGRLLLAHELVHVLQQRGITRQPNRSAVAVGDPHDPVEAEADRVANEVMGGGPISRIHGDTAGVIRRVIQVDPASVVMTVDAGVSKAKPTVEIVGTGGSQIALAHLTQGVNAAQVATAGLAGVTDPVIKMNAKFDMLLDADDEADMTGFNFGFLQIAKVFAIQDIYVGRTQNEGHIILKHDANVSPKVTLDTVGSFSPFSSRVPAFNKPVKKGDKRVVSQSVDLGVLPGKTGDAPMSKSKAFLDNRDTNAPNFMFDFRADLEFTTVLVVIDPQNKVQALSHVIWHLVWHFQFKWKGATNPVATSIPITSGSNFGLVTKGPPKDPEVAALVAAPKGPFTNDITNAAKAKTVLGPRPNREDNFSRPANVPKDFFS